MNNGAGTLGFIIGALISGVFFFLVGLGIGMDNPNHKAKEKIELAVYEKELGRDIGLVTYKCKSLGGILINRGPEVACFITDKELMK